MKRQKLRIENHTRYDGRTIRGIVTFVSKWLEVDTVSCLVVIEEGRYHGYCDRWGNHVTVWVPPPERFEGKLMYWPYKRIGAPEPWELADWREALVAVLAHELMHVRQAWFKPRKRGQFTEKETDWAARRIWSAWCARVAG